MLCLNQSLRMARLRAATCLRILGASSGQWQTSPALGAAALYTPVTSAPAYGKLAFYSVLAVVHLCRSGLLVFCTKGGYLMADCHTGVWPAQDRQLRYFA